MEPKITSMKKSILCCIVPNVCTVCTGKIVLKGSTRYIMLFHDFRSLNSGLIPKKHSNSYKISASFGIITIFVWQTAYSSRGHCANFENHRKE